MKLRRWIDWLMKVAVDIWVPDFRDDWIHRLFEILSVKELSQGPRDPQTCSRSMDMFFC